jgi:hypothetical protein
MVDRGVRVEPDTSPIGADGDGVELGQPYRQPPMGADHFGLTIATDHVSSPFGAEKPGEETSPFGAVPTAA